MSASIIPFPGRELSAVEQYDAYIRSLVSSMRRHWRGGLRDDAFHAAVRAEFPECDLDTYNHAADVAWLEASGDRP